jgi:hypothetical protein
MLRSGVAKVFICRVEYVINRRLEMYTSFNNSGNLIGYTENNKTYFKRALNVTHVFHFLCNAYSKHVAPR